MKIAVGRDPEDAAAWSSGAEIVRFQSVAGGARSEFEAARGVVLARSPRGGEVTARRRAPIAEIVETPACFSLKADLANDPYLQRLLALTRDLPPGTIVRARLSDLGQKIPDGLAIPPDEWDIDIVGPN